jgi:hypothetical protein
MSDANTPASELEEELDTRIKACDKAYDTREALRLLTEMHAWTIAILTVWVQRNEIDCGGPKTKFAYRATTYLSHNLGLIAGSCLSAAASVGELLEVAAPQQETLN